MRLLYFENGRFCLTDYLLKDIPPYAILSHRWSATQDEVSFQDIKGVQDGKTGWAKLCFCREQVRKDDLKYFWVDTCCINKEDRNGIEMQKSIASMFKWYANAQHCYVYMADVTTRPLVTDGEKNSKYPWKRAFARSQWFTRGWTLQELLAPTNVSFYSKDGVCLGTRSQLSDWIHSITNIDKDALQGKDLSEYSEADRFSWAVNRDTMEPEDRAYCLLGIFGVSMAPHYGEGLDAAYDRLKEAIIIKRRNELIRLDPRQGQMSADRQSTISLDSSRAPSIIFPIESAISAVTARRVSTLTSSAPSTTATSRRPFAKSIGVHQRHDVVYTSARRDAIRKQIPYPGMPPRRLASQRPFPDASSWVLQHEAYRAWMNPARMSDSFLWINGLPGAGKTTLTRFLEHHLTRSFDTRTRLSGDYSTQTADRPGRVISFYFDTMDYSLAENVAKAYRSLLYQLLKGFPSLESVLDPLDYEFTLGGFDYGPDDYFDRVSVPVLQNLFAAAVSQLGDRRLYCLLDVPDGTSERDCLDLIDFFRNLQHGSRMMTCLASGYYPSLDIESPRISLEIEPGHNADILSYIDLRLQVGSSGAVLASELHERANGNFLWTVLAVAFLNREYLQDTRTPFETLVLVPSQLSALLTEICRSRDIPPDDFALCMQWLLYSFRPLRIGEFYFALQSGLSTADGSELNLARYENKKEDSTRSNYLSFDKMEEFVQRYSKGLARVDDRTAVLAPNQFVQRYDEELIQVDDRDVEPIHESVREFLLGKDGLATMYRSDTTTATSLAHERLKLCCNTGVMYAHRNGWVAPSEGHQVPLADVRLPFTSYARHYQFAHADKAAAHIAQGSFLAQFPKGRHGNLTKYSPVYENWRYRSTIQALIGDGLYTLLHDLLSDERTRVYEVVSNEAPPRRESELEFALAEGDVHMVELLLHHGARLWQQVLGQTDLIKEFGYPEAVTARLLATSWPVQRDEFPEHLLPLPPLPEILCGRMLRSLTSASALERQRKRPEGLECLHIFPTICEVTRRTELVRVLNPSFNTA